MTNQWSHFAGYLKLKVSAFLHMYAQRMFRSVSHSLLGVLFDIFKVTNTLKVSCLQSKAEQQK